MGDGGERSLSSGNGGGPKAIAIIGMACRLPAGATDVENLWTALANGQSGWSPHPVDRYVPEKFYHPNPDKKGCYDQKGAHYLEEDLACFDAAFFNVTAAEAVSMDPQHRHLLEVTYEALENAGVTLSSIAGTSTGVFIGGNPSEYRSYIHQDLDNMPMMEATGNAESLLANRLSYVFDLRGPSMAIDTACSSSLVALNTAFQSMQAGESSAAIVGGSHLTITSSGTVSLSTTRLLSPDGKSYAFDERATSGFGRGEGTSCIILKPLDTALRDGDPIRAIIRNSGANQDGKTAGITMPNGQAQTDLMRSVYDIAGLDPLETDYVEAHGTGTATGDPVEAKALGEVFGRGLDRRSITIGSLKSNIGHLEATSGVSSVIKTALMLERKFLVPNCDLQTLNPKIPFDEWNMKVSRKYKPWDSDRVRRASVNNFGFGGTNAHIVMEEALFRPDGDLMEHDSGLGTPDSTNIPDNPMILTEERLVYVFSANDKGSLQRQVSALAEYVKERPALIFPQLMRSMAYTLGSRRSAHAWKLAVAATTQDELVQNLKDVALTPIKSTEQPRIGFLFTGQGSQWATMGRSLYCAYPVYASAIRKADETLRNLGASWSLIDELDKAQELSMIDRPYVSQPACTALQIALVDLLSSWGITPKCVSGHSSGEIAAAYAAEILELETCMAIAYYRGVVAMTLKEDPERVPGGMLAVGATQAEAQLLIDESQGANVRIACLNSPSSITLSGDAPGIAQIQELANSKSIWNRRLKIDVAYHSHHMEVVAGKYRRLLGELEPRVHSSIQFFSSLKGTLVESSSLITSYWIENLTCPVLFTSSVQSLCETARPGSKRGVDMLIELGPHAALQGPVRQILQSLEGSCRTIQSLPSLVRNADEVKSITQLSSRLFINGAPIELKNVNFPNARSNYPDILTDLPTYQWNHSKRYWHDCRSSQESRTHSSPRHDLLGNRVSDCNLLEPQWKNVLVADDVPWLRDHRVQEMTVFPLAGYLCMAMEACRQQAQWKDTKYDRIVFREISIFQALTIHDSSPVELRLSFLPFSESTRSSSEIWNQFKIFSWTSEGSWMEHCRGLVGTRLPDQANSVDIQSKNQSSLDKDTEAWRQQMELCSESVDAAKVYRVSAGSGFEFGPSFRQITDVMMGPSETVYTATVPDTASCMPYNYESDYIIHPISLDALFQSALFLLSNGGRDYASPYMPVAVKELTVMTNVIRKPGTTYKLFARCEASDMFSRKRLFDCAAMNSLDDSTSCGVLVKGLTEVPIQRSQIAQDDDKSRCLRVQWEPCMSYLMQSQCKKIFGSDHEDPIDLMTAYMVKLAHQNPSLRVLEIGGVTDVPVTLPILKSLGGTFGAPASFAHYDYTDSVPGFTETSQASLVPWGKLVGHRKLDIGESPVAQGFAPESYDVVIVTDFSLVDSDEDNRLKNVRSLLRAGGKLLLANVASEKTDGSTNVIRDGVDVKTKDSGKGSIEHKQETASVKDNWNNMLVVNGFSGLDGTYLGNRDAGNVIFSTAVPLASMPDELTPDLVIVSQWLPHGISRNVVEANLNPTNSINVRWIEFSELADENLHRKHCIVIDNPEATFMTSLTAESFQGLKNLPQAAGILWLTGGISSPNGGLVRGFARTIRAEFQIRDFVTLAIDVWDTPTDETVELIGKVYERSLRWTAKDTEFDMELAIIDGTVHVPRFFQDVAMDQSLARETQKGSRDLQPFFQEGRPLKLTIAIPGFLDTLCFVDDDRAAEPLRDDEIEIDIQATGLNFKDVILALGQLAGNHLGQECSGVVTKVGSDVSYIKPGQRVCAIAASTMANIGRCKAYCATPIPDFMSFAQGASIPIIYCTVYYCLARIANLRAGETILIHAAAGGVGQSAIMLAQAMKAKIIATVGSPEKKEFLMQTYNIPEDCIFYSRDTSFLQRVLHTTNGVGVDVALNSLAGEQLRATWQCMARFGRFVEIGKRDITSNMNLEMSRFEHSVSFSAFDLTDLIQFRPHMLQEMFLELMDLFRSGAINTVSPIHEFPASQVEQAFRSLQTGKLMGKLVIVPQRDDMVMATRPSVECTILRTDVSYLITGGTGGIGRATCEWMAEHGAKNIVLASRSGKTDRAMALIKQFSPLGVTVEVCKADVAIEADVHRLIAECGKKMPPIGGVIHGAYVNKDALFDEVDFKDWIDVVQPKFHGAWNIHNALLSHSQPLDFFVMLSSISGVIGNRGQAAYAAANSFLDSFAHYRVSLGLAATSIDLGVVKEIGYVADRPDLQANLESLSGDAALNKADVLALIKLAVTGQIDRFSNHQSTVGLTFENYSPHHPAFFWATDARFSHLRRGVGASAESSSTNVSPKQALKKAHSLSDAVRIACETLVGKFSSVLIVPEEEISTEKSVVSLGLDSLVAVEVRSWIKREMDATMSTMELLTSSSIGALAEMVVGKSVLCEGLRGKAADEG